MSHLWLCPCKNSRTNGSIFIKTCLRAMAIRDHSKSIQLTNFLLQYCNMHSLISLPSPHTYKLLSPSLYNSFTLLSLPPLGSNILSALLWNVLKLRVWKCQLTLWSRSSSECYLRIQSVPQREHLTITKINWLTLFKEIIAVYSENHAKPINTKFSITDCQSGWFI
jgi:hypothetical protein